MNPRPNHALHGGRDRCQARCIRYAGDAGHARCRGAAVLQVLALLAALLVTLPLLSIVLVLAGGGSTATWSHLLDTVLGRYVANTLWLCLGVGSGVIALGVPLAWLVTRHDFPGRRVFEWALVLPLAVPAYVMAYTWTDLLQFAGPVQGALRSLTGWQAREYWFPEVRSLGGAAVLFVLVLYPYVYLLARSAFVDQAGNMLEAGRSLGLKPAAAFRRIALPLARPAIAGGCALALMETLADYGTVSYFGVETFTTGIYRAWFALGDRVAAAQLAASLLGVVVLVLLLEQHTRGRARYAGHGRRATARHAPRLRGVRAWSATLACLVPLGLGFLLPAGRLLWFALTDGDAQFGARFFVLARNSFVLAALTALIAVAIAVALAYAARVTAHPLPRLAKRAAGLGYAVPGAVIAVGVLLPVTRLDHLLIAVFTTLTGHSPGLLLTGGIAALIYAYLVRFLAIALQSVDAGLARITPSMDEAARCLGHSQAATLRRVHLPLLRGSLLGGALLVFVDVLKELPATLVMRPFNFDTLATQTYQLAADERLAEASTAALAIVAVGMLPLVMISRQITGRARPGTTVIVGQNTHPQSH